MKKTKCTCCHRVNPDPVGKARAMAEARRTIKLMNRPSDWTVNIHHNINWHWSIRCGLIIVFRSGAHYWAMMADSEDAPGSPIMSIGGVSWGLGVEYSRDPNKVALRVLDQARKFVHAANVVITKQRNRMGV